MTVANLHFVNDARNAAPLGYGCVDFLKRAPELDPALVEWALGVAASQAR
jgi:hypothetical protein